MVKIKTKGDSYLVVGGIAFVIIIMVTYIGLFSSVSDFQMIRSLSLPLDSQRIKQTPQEMTSKTITCYRSHSNYDLCLINGSCILNLKTKTLTLMDPTFATSTPLVQKIRPYPRKEDKRIMSKIKELTLTSSPLGLTQKCHISHDLSAIVFSAGGYTGNVYHDFADGLIPLFITANTVFPDRDFVLVIADPKKWWMPKYIDVLSEFSKHKPILLDNESDSTTHCFTSAIVGLISHGPMIINQSQIPNSKSLVDFNNFLDKALNTNLYPIKTHKPRLLLVSRYGNIGRVLLNELEIKKMLEDVGFEVMIFRPSKTTSLRDAYRLIKSSHVMVGVHGAALTHLLFLRPGSVLVQVVPLGLGWAAKTCYETPAKAMKLEYITYSINVDESSLVKKYSRDDLVLKDPIAFRGIDWNVTKMNVYLKEQNVRLDVNRFMKHMNVAYKKAKSFMDING
ncbi:unnamed protein product [Cochlearia groenlandica]